MISRIITSVAWLFPFFSFFLGYLFFFLYIPHKSIPTPLILGKNLSQVACILAQEELNLRIIGYVEDKNIPEGTVLSQIPTAGQKIKKNQPVFCVISKKSTPATMPDIRSKTKTDIENILNPLGISASFYTLSSSHKSGISFAQIPTPQESFQDSVIVYVADSKNQLYLFPNLAGKTIGFAKALLQTYACAFEIFHEYPQTESHNCSQCIITKQNPLAGSIINLENPFTIQLKVSS